MTVWEYILLELVEPLHASALKMLDHYGAMGWECYAVTRMEDSSGGGVTRAWSTFHMKRPRPSQVRGKDE